MGFYRIAWKPIDSCSILENRQKFNRTPKIATGFSAVLQKPFTINRIREANRVRVLLNQLASDEIIEYNI